MFIRAGVPIVSPAYLTPSTTFVSLALQKFLGFKNVESIKFTQLSPTGAAMDVPIIMLHEAGPVSMEIGIFMSTLSSIGTFLYSLF